MQKELYEAAELEVIEFANEDIVTTSLDDNEKPPILDENEFPPIEF